MTEQWMSQAVCRDHDPETWFPGPGDRRTRARAFRICSLCPVIAECESYADRINARFGIWAGRSRIPRYEKPTTPSPHPHCGSMRGYHRHIDDNERPCAPCRAVAQARYNRRYRASLERVR